MYKGDLGEQFALAFREIGISRHNLPWNRTSKSYVARKELIGYGIVVRNLIAQDYEGVATGLSKCSNTARVIDIADFMLQSFNAVGFDVNASLADAGFPRGRISRLIRSIDKLAIEIGRLNDVHPGPIFFATFNSPINQGMIHGAARTLPSHLLAYKAMLMAVPVGKRGRYSERGFWRQYIEAYFSVYMHEALGSLSTTSALLRVMREARKNVTPNHPVINKVETSDDEDPLSEDALQRRLHRFFNRHRLIRKQMDDDVRTFFASSQLRRRKPSFLQLLETIGLQTQGDAK